MEVKEIIAEIKEKMAARGGLKHVYFVGCGGSKAAIFPVCICCRAKQKISAQPLTPAMNLFMPHRLSWMSGAWR